MHKLTLNRTMLAALACALSSAALADGSTSDFSQRCAGAFFCQGFDTPVATGTKGDEGVVSGSRTLATSRRPLVDKGVLHFEILPGQVSGGAGYYYFDFAERDGIKIGPGESIFVQWRQYMPAALVTTRFAAVKGKGTAPKQLIFSQDGESGRDSTCTPNQIVVVAGSIASSPGHRYPSMYNSCGTINLIELAGPTVGGSKRWDRQPIGNVAPSVARQCWRGNTDGCWEHLPDTWATYQVGLTVAPTSYVDSRGRQYWDCHVQLWAKTDGKPTEVVIDIVEPIGHADLKWGRVWLLPYMTKKDPAQVHPETFTDYDELILSRQRIPDPQ